MTSSFSSELIHIHVFSLLSPIEYAISCDFSKLKAKDYWQGMMPVS